MILATSGMNKMGGIFDPKLLNDMTIIFPFAEFSVLLKNCLNFTIPNALG